MSNINKQALRLAAEKAKHAGEAPVMSFDQRISALKDFQCQANPAAVLALLDELEAAEKRGAELESREVKLPERYDIEICPLLAPNGEWYARNDVLAALSTAGVSINRETEHG